MRILMKLVWLVVFLLLFAFAVTNTGTAQLRFIGDMAWQAPLIVLLLAFFLAGFVFGILAFLPGWVRMTMEVRRLRRAVPVAAVVAADSVGQQGPDTIQSVAQGARTTL